MKAGPGTTTIPSGKTKDLPMMTSANHFMMTVMAKDDLIQAFTIIHLENADVVVAEVEAVASEVASEVEADSEADLLESRISASATALSASGAFHNGITATIGRNKKDVHLIVPCWVFASCLS